MDRNDRQAIEALFDKLATVERQSPPRDGESEAFIRDKIARQPGAPYYMAQTIVIQEQALAAAEARLSELEAQAVQTSPGNEGFFGSLFGDRSQPARSTGSVPRVGSPNLESMNAQHRGGGGFLAGAAQTALGVTGGVLLGNAIAGMLGGSEAKAAEPATDKGTEESQEEPQTEEADFDDGGADLGRLMIEDWNRGCRVETRSLNKSKDAGRRLTSMTEGPTSATSMWTSEPRQPFLGF